jgi:hypothetical protein
MTAATVSCVASRRLYPAATNPPSSVVATANETLNGPGSVKVTRPPLPKLARGRPSASMRVSSSVEVVAGAGGSRDCTTIQPEGKGTTSVESGSSTSGCG